MEKNYLEILNACKLDATTKIPNDNIYFVIQNKCIGSTGNFVSLVGLPKAGKSTFISAIIAAGISKKEIFGMNIITYENKYRIALFDTEQSNIDFQNKAKQIKRLSKQADIYKNLDVYTVTEHSANTIMHLIKMYLEITPTCAVLVVDGILDLIDNMNDEKQSKYLTKFLRVMAKKFDVLIITVLHLGKKDKTSIGHIGSSSDRYAQSTLEIEKTKEGTFKMSAKMLRSASDFEPIELAWSDDNKSYIHLNP